MKCKIETIGREALDQADYVLLDAAAMNDDAIYQARALNPDFLCLYAGQSREELADVAPYLFTFPEEGPFRAWLEDASRGKNWAVYVMSEGTLEELYKHFRKFLVVGTEAGKQLYFRFYDPRVLRDFLPTCDADQLREMFGLVAAYLLECGEGEEWLALGLEPEV